MRILFVDDEPDSIALVARTIAEALDAGVVVADSAEAAREHLAAEPWDLVVMDIFLPLSSRPERPGRRARDYAETLRHLGGLVLLDDLDRMRDPPPVLAHTECTDFELLEVLGRHVVAKVPKPAPPDVLLRAVLEALDLPVPG